MAEGYVYASGKLGVVVVTPGPGATNIITPIADAYADGTPMIVFSGQVTTAAIGGDAFQEADVISISRACHTYGLDNLPLSFGDEVAVLYLAHKRTRTYRITKVSRTRCCTDTARMAAGNACV